LPSTISPTVKIGDQPPQGVGSGQEPSDAQVGSSGSTLSADEAEALQDKIKSEQLVAQQQADIMASIQRALDRQTQSIAQGTGR
jgi:hypothetical protein